MEFDLGYWTDEWGNITVMSRSRHIMHSGEWVCQICGMKYINHNAPGLPECPNQANHGKRPALPDHKKNRR